MGTFGGLADMLHNITEVYYCNKASLFPNVSNAQTDLVRAE